MTLAGASIVRLSLRLWVWLCPGAEWVGLLGAGVLRLLGLPRQPATCYASRHMKPTTSPIRHRRGAVDPVTLGVIAVIGVGIILMKPSDTPGRKYWWQVWKKNPV